MRKITFALLASLLGALLPGAARAQSNPGFLYGQIPTAAQWNAAFAAKQDYLGYTPLNPANVVGAEPITSTTVGTTITLGFDYTHAGTFTAVQQVDLNVSILQAAQAGTVFRIANVDGTDSRLEVDAFAAVARFTGLRADGTAASPTAVQSGDEIGSLNDYGYNGSAYVGPRAALRCYAGQNWTTGANGTYCDVATTANGATSEAEVVRFFGSGGVSIGNTTDPGAGNLSVNGSIVQPTFTFGTGAGETIAFTSTNTGFANQVFIDNGGTLSNSSTTAGIVVNLTAGATNAYAALQATGGTNPSAFFATGAGMTGGFIINSSGGNPLVLEGTGDAAAPVQMNFGTGGGSNIQALSANTGNANQFFVNNTGTASTAGTEATMVAELTGTGASNNYLGLYEIGGSTPIAELASGAGNSGGLLVTSGAGNLQLASATFNTYNQGTNTGSAVNFFATNNGIYSTAGTSAVVTAQLGGLSNGSVYISATGGSSPIAYLASQSGFSAGLSIISGAGSIALSSASNVINFNGSGTNTGATVQAEINNSGTVSNSATIAQFVANLSAGSDTFFALQAIGGSSPTATLGAGSGLTGGMSITTAAGGISLEPTTSVSVVSAPFGLSGNQSASAWTTSGIRYKNVAATLTDTSSSGTVATAYTSVFGGDTIAASSAVTYTNYFAAYFKAPVAGTNVTFTANWGLGADSFDDAGAMKVGGTATFADGSTYGSSGISGTTINNSAIGGSTAAAVTGTTVRANSGFSADGTAGLASKTCTINTTNVTTGITITITEGIVTGTTTC